MVNPQLEKALESREVLRLQEDGLDVRVYDTDQILVLGKERKDISVTREGNNRFIEEMEIPFQAILDLRSGENSYFFDTRGIEYSGTVGGKGPACNIPRLDEISSLLQRNGFDLHKWDIPDDSRRNSPQRYPELSEFVNEIHNAFVKRKWERHEIAIKGFLPTLALAVGHGNVPPSAFLRPRVIWEYIAGTAFPFKGIDVFNFEKGRKNLEGRTEYIASNEGASYGGNIVLIRPWDSFREDERDHACIEAHFFNPSNYKKFLDGQLNAENPLPSARDWGFKITYGIEYGRKWLRFSAGRFDYMVRKEGLLDQKKNDVYLKTESSLVETLEKISPLPL